MSSDKKTITVLGVCWGEAELAEPFVLGRQYPGIGMVGNDLPPGSMCDCRKDTFLL